MYTGACRCEQRALQSATHHLAGIVGTARKPERRKPSNEEQSRLHVGLGCWDVCYRSGEGTSSQPVCADAGWNFGT